MNFELKLMKGFRLFIIVIFFSCKKNNESTQDSILTSKEKLKASVHFANTMQVHDIDPIIYTIRSNDSISSIPNGIIVKATDKRFNYLNIRNVIERVGLSGYVEHQATDYGDSTRKLIQANVSSVEFLFSGSEFELLLFGSGFSNAQGNLHIEVEGMMTNSDGYPAPSTSDGKNHFVNVKFKNVVNNKHIKIIYSGFRLFGGIVTERNAEINKFISNHDSKIVIFGDSYVAGVGAQYHFTKYFSYRLGSLLGISNSIISGVGGTGYLNPNITNNRKTFYQRIDDILLAKPDAVIVAGGINDVGYASPSNLENASLHFFQSIRSALPNVVIIVVGPWWPSGYNYPNLHRDALKRSVEKVSDVYFIDVTGWITGTGNTALPNGTGNADIYISSDRVHPNIVGHMYLADKLAIEIKYIINSF